MKTTNIDSSHTVTGHPNHHRAWYGNGLPKKKKHMTPFEVTGSPRNLLAGWCCVWKLRLRKLSVDTEMVNVLNGD
jgi:hypothetical protein